MQLYICQYDIAWEDRSANHEQVTDLFASADFQPDSFVVLPEMFDTGFSMNTAYTAGPTATSSLPFLKNLAIKYHIYLVAGIVPPAPDNSAVNQAVIFSPQGKELTRYTKIHTFTFADEHLHYQSGNTITTVICSEFTICPLICYDLRFPETFRAALTQNTQMFVVIANFPAARHDHWQTLLKARAIENQSYIVAVNRTGQDPNTTYAGGSTIIAPDGKILMQADEKPGIFTATANLISLQQYRIKFPTLPDMTST